MTSQATAPTEQSADMDPGAEIADFAAGLTLHDLPENVVAKLKDLLIDTVGVVLGAQDQAHTKQARAVAMSGGGAPQAAILGTSLRTSTMDAAFANGVAAH